MSTVCNIFTILPPTSVSVVELPILKTVFVGLVLFHLLGLEVYVEPPLVALEIGVGLCLFDYCKHTNVMCHLDA